MPLTAAAAMRAGVLAALLWAAVLGAGGSAAEEPASRSVALRGAMGMLSEWSVQARLEPGERGGVLAGPLTLRHKGICEAGGRSVKTGRVSAVARGNSLGDLVLFFEDEHCTLAGPLPVRATSTAAFARCNKGAEIPITFWFEAGPASGAPPDAARLGARESGGTP